MVDIVFLLDESYSMKHYSQSYITGINTIISTQKHNNTDTTFSLIKFNDAITPLCINRKIQTLSEFTSDYYKPDSSTSLYDCIGYAINLKLAEGAKSVIIFILTDGDDNASFEYNVEDIAKLISTAKYSGWEFVYIATNQDAKVVGKKLGIETCLTYEETDKCIGRVADSCNIAIGHMLYKCSGIPNYYSEQEIPTEITDLTDILDNCRI